MPKKRFSAEQIVTLLRQIEVSMAQGKATPMACRDAGISQQSYYRWRKEYGGLEIDQAKRMKDLERENKRINTPDEKSRKAGLSPKAMLRADKASGSIQLDSETQLTGVPPEAWTYKLGNRSALEWILDQYKEKTPKDPTIREKFNTYDFAEHKEKMLSLIHIS